MHRKTDPIQLFVTALVGVAFVALAAIATLMRL
jgi:hypothetical protein